MACCHCKILYCKNRRCGCQKAGRKCSNCLPLDNNRCKNSPTTSTQTSSAENPLSPATPAPRRDNEAPQLRIKSHVSMKSDKETAELLPVMKKLPRNRSSPAAGSNSSVSQVKTESRTGLEPGRPVPNASREDPIKPHEKRALNFLCHKYLIQQDLKRTAITLTEENGDQDFDDWDDVGLNIPKPPTLVELYRDYTILSDKERLGRITDLDLENLLSQVKKENEARIKKSEIQSLQPSVHGRPTGVRYSPPTLSGSRRAGAVELLIASWNLKVFKYDKEHPEVLEKICHVILQHKFDIIAVQELCTQNKLDIILCMEKVCQELNERDDEKEWECCVSSESIGQGRGCWEWGGFLWNNRLGIELNTSGIIKTRQTFARKPFVGQFTVNQITFLVVSVHLKAVAQKGPNKERKVKKEVSQLAQQIEPISLEDSDEILLGDVILLGDFNMHPGAKCFQALWNGGYRNVLGDIDHTNIGDSKCLDNVWVHINTLGLRYSSVEVVRENVPLYVSDHCPILATFYVY